MIKLIRIINLKIIFMSQNNKKEENDLVSEEKLTNELK